MENERSEYAKKQFYSIGEVAEIVGTNESTLRFWEREFKEIKPRRASRGVRLYSNGDLETVKLIHYLVKEKGLTLDGAKKRLKENTSKESNTMQVINKLKDIRAELMSIRNYIEILEIEEKERFSQKSSKGGVKAEEAQPVIYQEVNEELQLVEESQIEELKTKEEKPSATESSLEENAPKEEPPFLSLF